MKIKMRKFTFLGKPVAPGDEVDVDEAVGKRLVSRGIAERVEPEIPEEAAEVKEEAVEKTAKELFDLCREKGLAIEKSGCKGKSEEDKKAYFKAILAEAELAEQVDEDTGSEDSEEVKAEDGE